MNPRFERRCDRAKRARTTFSRTVACIVIGLIVGLSVAALFKGVQAAVLKGYNLGYTDALTLNSELRSSVTTSEYRHRSCE